MMMIMMSASLLVSFLSSHCNRKDDGCCFC